MKRSALSLAALALFVVPACQAADGSAHEIYKALNALRPDPAAVYEIKPDDRIALHRSDMEISLDRGKLAFYAPYHGRVTGAVFSGSGHALAVPRDPVEKQQMGRFLGAPLLDQEFGTAYFRFTDDTASELLRQLKSAGKEPQRDPDFTEQWNAPIERFNPPHSMRLLFDSFTTRPRPYFYAGLAGLSTGYFDFLLDYDRAEPFVLGQMRKDKEKGRSFYDVWASYAPPDSVPPVLPFRALQYNLSTTILANDALEGTATVRFAADGSADRRLILELSRALAVDSVTNENGKPLEFFQNEGMTAQERATRGNDLLYLVLPAAFASGGEFTLTFRYHGNVIENAGNGVLYVGAHDTWYPRFGDGAAFARYELTMRWPRKLRLVATGVKIDEHEEGDCRAAHWRTETPVSVMGFNLGDYVSGIATEPRYSVEVFANKQIEQALSSRLQSKADLLTNPAAPFPFSGVNRLTLPETPLPSPAEALKKLGKEIDLSVKFYETLSGPFPFRTLSISEIPGTAAQGWPGLVYLPTLSYLAQESQQRMGLNTQSQEHFTDLAPFHEVAHQWWGNIVGWSSYRDQWIDEALANYLAVLFADSQKLPDRTVRVWLERFRDRLLAKIPGIDDTIADAGALTLGTRLDSSKSPNAYEAIIYNKGAWVIHMIREMLREPGAKNPDARFIDLLRTLQTKYAYRALSTADLRKEVEAKMTKSMDLEGGHSLEWFFEEWVNGIGIPHYRMQFTTSPAEKGVTVRGKLFQTGVPRSFIAPVPIYARDANGHLSFLGTVIATGEETPFRFAAAAAPHKLAIDPQMTLLCTIEAN
jgi:hypothetical protein